MVEQVAANAEVGERPRPLHRNRWFVSFWTGQFLSNTGSQVSELALPLTAALVLSATPAQMGLLTALEALPNLLVGLVLGVLVDRVRRGPLLLWCNLAQAAVLVTVPVAAWSGWLSLGQLYVVVFVAASLALTNDLARATYLPSLVDRRQLTAANSSLGLTDSVAAAAGPGLGGLLVQLLTAPLAILVDVGSFVAAALLQLGARRPEPPPGPSGRLVASVRDGLAEFRRHRGILVVTLGKGTFDFFHWGVLAISILFAVRDLHLRPVHLGLVGTIGTLGPLAAAALVVPVSRRFGAGWTSVVAAALVGGNLLIPFAGGPLWMRVGVLTLAYVCVGLGAVYLDIIRTTMLQQAVPAALMGRVSAAIKLVEWGPGPVGALTGGLLGEVLGLRTGLVVLGVGCLLGVPWIAVAARRGWIVVATRT